MGVFDLAWSLYRRGFFLLVLAGLFSAVVEAVLVRAAIVLGIAGGAGTHQLGAGIVTSVYTGLGAATVGLLLAQLVTLVLRGGMMKMVIDCGRTGERMDFTSLFAGFRRILSYAGLWGITSIAVPLGLFALSFVSARILGPLSIFVGLGSGIFMIWLVVSWVYALPLIADLGLDPIAALTRSRSMVRENGWWTTFVPLLLLGIVTWVVMTVLVVAMARSGNSFYLSIGVLELLAMPYMICFIAAMYMGGQRRTPAPAQASWPAYPGPGSYPPPAGSYVPPAAPYYGPPPGASMAPASYGAAPSYPAAPSYAPAPASYAPAAPDYGQPHGRPEPLDPVREADAWAGAADPLAGMPPRDPD